MRERERQGENEKEEDASQNRGIKGWKEKVGKED